jgi:hypothetical protein
MLLPQLPLDTGGIKKDLPKSTNETRQSSGSHILGCGERLFASHKG